MAEVRFYLDENVPLEVAPQLALSGIDVVSAHSEARLGDADADHLRRASADGRVLCTHDQDFLRLAAQGIDHSGIVFLPQVQGGVGEWVRGLRAIHARLDKMSAGGRVIFLPLR